MKGGAASFSASSWPGLSRPSTSWQIEKKGVDARVKPGHDESVARLKSRRSFHRSGSVLPPSERSLQGKVATEFLVTPSQTISILRYRWMASSRAAEIIRDRPQLAITAPQRRNSFLNLTFDTATIGSEAHAVIWMGGGASHGHRGAVVSRRGCDELFDIDRRNGLA